VHGYASEACRNQAFRKGRVVGLQCHLEFTRKALAGLIEAQDRFEGRFVQPPEEFLGHHHDYAGLQERLFAFLDALEREILPT
jgi:GMP synthase-like glutamine amidotransferase